MPRVSRDAEVTLVTLIYRDTRWLDFVMQGVDDTRQSTRYRWLVVANDATESVRADSRVDIDWHNEDPAEYYLNRVYRAWSEGVLNSPTQWCILLNSDMLASDYAVDELVAAKHADSRNLPCGLLVENGRIPSGMPEHVQDFGTTPETFKRAEFREYAKSLRQLGVTEPGRLFQPVLFDRQQFLDAGGYPAGNVGGVSGDKILFDRLVQTGYKWTTCLGSVFYHVQEGEMRDGQ